MQKLIVFDSGTGGKIFAAHLRNQLQNVEIIEVIDGANSPYGEKTPAEIIRLVTAALSPFLGARDTSILLACNTATTISIKILRAKYPHQTFIGIEPMLKSASEISKTRRIMTLATPATLKTPSYQDLKSTYCQDCQIFEPNTKDLARFIDQQLPTLDYLRQATQDFQNQNIDTIVLACTHYLAVKDEIQQLFPDSTILSPLEPVTKRLQTLLK